MCRPQETPEHAQGDHTLARLDRMVVAGRVTPNEAARMREARDETERAAALTAIRCRHATERINTAVAAGDISREEADKLLARLAAGEDPTALRPVLPKAHRAPVRPPREDE